MVSLWVAYHHIHRSRVITVHIIHDSRNVLDIRRVKYTLVCSPWKLPNLFNKRLFSESKLTYIWTVVDLVYMGVFTEGSTLMLWNCLFFGQKFSFMIRVYLFSNKIWFNICFDIPTFNRVKIRYYIYIHTGFKYSKFRSFVFVTILKRVLIAYSPFSDCQPERILTH